MHDFVLRIPSELAVYGGFAICCIFLILMLLQCLHIEIKKRKPHD